MRRWTILLLAAMACGPGRPVQVDIPPLDSRPVRATDTRSELERRLDDYIAAIGADWGRAFQFSGYVQVVRGSAVLYSRAFGYADHETAQPNTADTSFRIGSVTKQFTAAAILVLEQQGELKTTDTIGDHLPSYPEPGSSITIHQLLTHTSGIPSLTNDPQIMARRDRPHTVRQLLESFWDKPLEFSPGEKFAYSNSGYIVLGAIIEAASGSSYAGFLKSALFDPAGLTNTWVGDRGDNRALGYEPGLTDDDLQLAHDIDMSVPFSAGSIRSTAADLVRWHRALDSDAILSESSRRKLITPEPATGESRYAYGWNVQQSDGRTIVLHGGGIDGFSTQYLRVPQDDLVVVAWSNNTGVRVSPIANAAVAAALGKPIAPLNEPKPAKLDVALAAKLVGAYELSPDSRKHALATGLPQKIIDTIETIEVTRAIHGIEMKPKAQPAAKMRAIEGGGFYNRAADVRLVPELADDGSVSRLRLSQGALILEYVPQ